MQLQVKILNTKLGQQWHLPNYATHGSAGMDLRACIEEPLQISPSETILIPTGLAVYINDPKVAGMIIPRSGLGHKHGIVLGNLTGLIDSDYQGEIKISCWNRSNSVFEISPGDRIAQLVIVPVIQVTFDIVDDFDTSTRGDGGFGHSGLK
jgi:dUTP pyrophosphatase